MIELGLDKISDIGVRDNFAAIQEEFKSPIYNFKFQFFELNFTAAVTNYRFKHNMPFLPKDVIVTSQKGAGVATFNYSLFDKDYLDITTTDAVKIRFLVGNFNNDSNA